MTCYHVSGSLYLKATEATKATEIEAATAALAADTVKTFTNFRNFNISTKEEITKDRTQHIQVSLRFKTEAELTKAVDQLIADVKDRVNEDYFSTLEHHVCHHDEGVTGAPPENQVVLTWGKDPTPDIEEKPVEEDILTP